MIRQVLKESFPAIKFSVKSKTYSGGASIRVSYQDGPTVETVNGQIGIFERSYFDGMIDYKGARYHTLDDKEVRFGADFIFVERSLSKGRAEAIVNHFSAHYGRADWLEVSGDAYFGYHARVTQSAPAIGQEVSAYDTSTCGIEVQESETLKRVRFTGDDGYGAGTVGRDGKGIETGLGYPSVRS